VRIIELDGLRGIAILGVLAVHSYVGIPGGWLGIDLFFVLSGYVITSALMRDASIPRFYRRRILRILPPLAGAIALASVVAPGFRLEPLTYFYANFVAPETLGSLGHTWYLSIEEQFYLLWPLAFLFLRRGFTLAIVIGVAWTLHVWMAMNVSDLDTIHRSTFSRMDALAVGCAVALARPHVGKRVGQAACALIVVSFFFAKPAPLTLAVGLILFPLVCAGVIAASQHVAFLRDPLLVYFGTRAWGIYLYHYPLFLWLDPLLDPSRPVQWLLVAMLKVALSVAAAELSWRTLEQWTWRIEDLVRRRRSHPA